MFNQCGELKSHLYSHRQPASQHLLGLLRALNGDTEQSNHLAGVRKSTLRGVGTLLSGQNRVSIWISRSVTLEGRQNFWE